MKKVIGYLGLGAIVVAGSLFGYKIASDSEFRGRLTRGAQDMYKESKKKVDSVTEDVALKTAQMTKNPKVNQDWVSNQWDMIGSSGTLLYTNSFIKLSE